MTESLTVGNLLASIQEVAAIRLCDGFDVTDVLKRIERELIRTVYVGAGSKEEKARRLKLSTPQYSRRVTAHGLSE